MIIQINNLKKKDLITASVITLLLAALLFGAIYLSTGHRRDKKPLPPRVIALDSQTFGKSIFFVERNTIVRCDYLSGRGVRLCGHEYYTADCALENVSGTLQLLDTRLYFCYHRAEGAYQYRVAYYDFNSGEVHDTGAEFNLNNGFFVTDGYIYYVTGNDIKRISVDGGSSERVASCERDEEIVMAANGKLYTAYGSSLLISATSIRPVYICTYDLETMTKNIIHRFTSAHANSVSKVLYLDGRIYLSLADSTERVSVGSGRVTYNTLWYIETATDKLSRVFDTYIDDFFLGSNKIYYIPYEERDIYAPEMGYDDGMYSVTGSASIHECDFDGGNDRVVFTDPDIALMKGHTVDGMILGSFIGRAPDGGTGSYGVIDTKSGKLKTVEMPF